MPTNADDCLLGEREVAALLGVSVAAIRQWRYEQRGPRWIKVEAAVRYRRQELDDYLASRTVTTSSTDLTRPEATT